MLKKLKDLFFYAGLTRRQFSEISFEIAVENRKNLLFSSAFATLLFCVLTLLSHIFTTLYPNHLIYPVSAAAAFVILLLAWRLKPGRSTLWLVYLFLYILYTSATLIGTISSPNERTTSFIVFLLALPLIFIDVPIRISIHLAINVTIFLIVCHNVKQPFTWQIDTLNAVIYCIVSIIVCASTFQIKASRLYSGKQILYISEHDALTGLWNRRKYESVLHELSSAPSDCIITVFMLDINGLKEVNDTVGHSAGDELIRSCARCAEQVFSSLGSVFRTGGDEFCIILTGAPYDINVLRSSFERAVSDWRGTDGLTLSVSVGCASSCAEENIPLSKLLVLADRNMYENKNLYYIQNHLDRRTH